MDTQLLSSKGSQYMTGDIKVRMSTTVWKRLVERNNEFQEASTATLTRSPDGPFVRGIMPLDVELTAVVCSIHGVGHESSETCMGCEEDSFDAWAEEACKHGKRNADFCGTCDGADFASARSAKEQGHFDNIDVSPLHSCLGCGSPMFCEGDCRRCTASFAQ